MKTQTLLQGLMNDDRTHNVHQSENVMPDALPVVAHHRPVHDHEHLVNMVILILMMMMMMMMLMTITSTQFSREAGGQTLLLLVDRRERPL